MANALIGEVALRALGQDFTFVFNINTLIDLEDTLEISTTDLLVAFSEGRIGVRQLRTIVAMALSARHPDMTAETAGLIMTEIGLPRVGDLIGQGLQRAFPADPEPQPQAQAEGDANAPAGPRTRTRTKAASATAGTGKSS